MSHPTFPDVVAASKGIDAEVEAVADWIETQPSGRERFRWVLRDATDELLDGGRTGRWNYLHLSKTEKTHLGTMIEIRLTREFEFPDGRALDWQIDGIDVDCKFSKDYGKWEIPREMYLSPTGEKDSGAADHVAVLVWLDDDLGRWSAGVMRVRDSRLRGSSNRDRKRKLNDAGLRSIRWLWGGRQDDLPENQLLLMDSAARERVFGASRASGQARVNALLREFNGRIVRRATVMTVAQQDDGMKRPRDARLHKHLGKEGFMILGHQDAHPGIARALNLPVPTKGEVMPVRLCPVPSTTTRRSVEILGRRWAVASDSDRVADAPRLPRKRPKGGWETYLNARS